MALAAEESVHLGDMLDRYRIVDRIGRGGMATVYMGKHTVLRHNVAIKVLHPEHSADPRMRLRLVNEARAVAAIRHPGIVELFDIGSTHDGRSYLVLELLTGESLEQRLARGPLPTETAVRFARQIASAVAAAHAHGIVHRDLKPQNIFIVRDDEVAGGERVKVLDFGIAKRTQAETPMPQITRTGVALGTPAYMSPEQCRGDHEIDGRADVYSLGVVLYHMITGRVPFGDASTDEQLDRHLYARPPSAACDEPAVAEVIARCLAKRPSQRFASMGEVASALEPAAKRALSTTAPVSKTRRPWRRPAGWAAALAAAGVVVSLVLLRGGERAGSVGSAPVASHPAPVARTMLARRDVATTRSSLGPAAAEQRMAVTPRRNPKVRATRKPARVMAVAPRRNPTVRSRRMPVRITAVAHKVARKPVHVTVAHKPVRVRAVAHKVARKRVTRKRVPHKPMAKRAPPSPVAPTPEKEPSFATVGVPALY